jgi:CheY-like chemotaxis protein/anti-sigma regulatory factor (Ser/Thr protein kinase)
MSTSSPVLLVVDDEPINLEIIGEHLDGLGYELVTAGDGAQALALLERDPEKYDAMLLDHMMPVLDGLSTLRRMKADPRFRLLPVIMQTAAASPEKIAEGLELGAHYYLTKPYEGAALRAVLRTALEGHAQARALSENVRSYSGAVSMLTEGRFRFRTLNEARQLAAALATACPDPQGSAMGLTELFVNAVEHGNLGIGYKEKSALLEVGRWEEEVERRTQLPENKEKLVEVGIARRQDGLQFVIRDSGPGFDFIRYLELAPERAYDLHGRGIAMARKLSFATLEYRGAGNEVVATIAEPVACASALLEAR